MKKQLKDAMLEAGYTEDEIKKFDEQFPEDDRQEKFAGGYLKNADYTAKTQQLAAEKKRMDEEADTYISSLSTYKTDVEKRLKDALETASKQRLYGAALEAKIQKLATEYGEDYNELMQDVMDRREGVKEPAKKAEFDDEEFSKNYVKREEFQQAGDHFFSYPVQLRDLEREYFRLYGKEYDGSLAELVKEASVEVNSQRARGKKDIDLFGYMRQKLDFEGQKARNAESAKVKSAEEQKKWEEDKAKEIETRLRSELLASNPTLSQIPKPDEWRQKLGARDRQEAKNTEQVRSPQDHARRQQSIHRAYEQQAAKAGEGRGA